jgi:Tol biopolymer transport system component
MKIRLFIIIALILAMTGCLLVGKSAGLLTASASGAETDNNSSCGTISFSGPTAFSVSRPRSIVIADFNNDNKPDLAAASDASVDTVSVLLGNGSGGFSNATTYNTGRDPGQIITADFNGDGNADLATANNNRVDGDVSILLGNGSGGFATAIKVRVTIPGGFAFARSVAAGDFNHDGKVDIALSTVGITYILLGNGDGTFASSHSLSGAPAPIITKDFNGDGKLDLAGANFDSDEVSIRLGDGAGNFGAATNFAVGSRPNSLVAEDFNGDGKADLATGNQLSDDISILIGDGTGSFAPTSKLPSGGVSPSSITSVDFNGDGKKDIAVANNTPGNVVLLAGNGAGSFQAVSAYYVGSDSMSLAAGDLNGDGDNDLAITTIFPNRLSVLLRNCDTSAGRVEFTSASYSAFEGDSGFPITASVVRNGDITGQGSVQYSTFDVTATAPADYTAMSGTFQFAAGDTFKLISIPIVNDSINESTETADVAVSNPTGAVVLGTRTNASLLIFDNDAKPSISVGDLALLEGNSGMTRVVLSIGLSNPSSSSVTVSYATSDGTADSVSDYTGASGQLTFAPGELSKNLVLAIKGDITEEANETFFLNITNSTNAVLAKSQGVVSIKNDDGNVTELKRSKIAFISDRDNASGITGNAEIYLMNPDGTGQERLTNNPAHDTDPSWSFDGKKIVFASNRENQGATQLDLYVMNADGTNQTRLSSTAESDVEPSWSPDSTRIVFVRSVLDTGARELYLIGADGSNLTKLTNNSLFEMHPKWSPDGKKIVFAGNGISTINPDGSGLTQLTNLASDFPVWSPDGTKIYFVSDHQLYVMNADGSQLTKLSTQGVGEFITLSPDGTKIAFETANLTGNSDIFTANATDGTGIVRLTNNAATDRYPAWQTLLAEPSSAGAMLELSADSYTINEGDTSGILVVTINRWGETSGDVSVDFATNDASGAVPCQTNGNGIASDRCDYATAAGTLRFVAGETSKTIQIPLINDSYVEPDETFTISLRNPQVATLGTASATVTIKNDDTQTASQNPIDNQAFFIKQQYVDFLGRVAEPSGFNFWMNRMNNCPQGQICDRIDTSQRFFQSDEFQERGFYVYRLYDAVLGRLPRYAEFVPDVARLNGFQTVAEQRQSKDAYLLDLMNKTEFRNLYGGVLSPNGLTATNPSGFVEALCARAGITPAAKQTLINNLQNGARDPAHTIEDFILTPEMSSVGTLYYDRGFITMQYFGYLRRDPEQAGFDFWQQQLIGSNAPHKGDYRFMVGGFLQSDEYRFRFALISAAP